MLKLNAPSVWGNEASRRETGRWERATASPGSIGALMRLNYDLDARRVLPVIQAPTLVLHRIDDSLVPSDCGRYLSENITGAKFVGMPGTDHSIVDSDTQDFIADKFLKEHPEFSWLRLTLKDMKGNPWAEFKTNDKQ